MSLCTAFVEIFRPGPRLWALGLGLSLAVSSSAHSVWIEPHGNHLAAFFGEAEGEPESSPGHLDSLTPPLAFAVATNLPVLLAVSKSTNHFALSTIGTNAVVCLEATYPVMRTGSNPGRKPVFYARWHPPGAGAGQPALTLDLVPTEKAGEVRVCFKSRPLPEVKVLHRTPDLRERELTSDAEGLVRVDLRQAGLHRLHVARYRETAGGFHAGQSYDLISHHVVLSWMQPVVMDAQ